MGWGWVDMTQHNTSCLTTTTTFDLFIHSGAKSITFLKKSTYSAVVIYTCHSHNGLSVLCLASLAEVYVASVRIGQMSNI